jgi:hypothetical protein
MLTSTLNFIDYYASLIATAPWWAIALVGSLAAFFAYAMIVLIVQR